MNKFSSLIFLTFISCALLFEACRKETTLDDSVILWKEFSPSIHLSCVDTMVPHPSGCGLIPIPSDSTSMVLLDVDSDGITDFEVTCTTWYQFVSASGPCANYNSSMIISGTSTNNEIATTGNWNEFYHFNIGELINANNQWMNYSTLQLHAAQGPFGADFNGLQYAGVRMKKDGEFHYGWVLFEKTDYNLYIRSVGIQTCPQLEIKAGSII